MGEIIRKKLNEQKQRGGDETFGKLQILLSLVFFNSSHVINVHLFNVLAAELSKLTTIRNCVDASFEN